MRSREATKRDERYGEKKRKKERPNANRGRCKPVGNERVRWSDTGAIATKRSEILDRYGRHNVEEAKKSEPFRGCNNADGRNTDTPKKKTRKMKNKNKKNSGQPHRWRCHYFAAPAQLLLLLLLLLLRALRPLFWRRNETETNVSFGVGLGELEKITQIMQQLMTGLCKSLA